MKLEQETKPYKKVDGIYSEEELKGWDKFWFEFGRFFAEAAAGRLEIKWTWKF
jgi:hypothetical protein